MAEQKLLLNKDVASQKLQRIALEIAEQLHEDAAPLVLIGIRNSGMVIAEKLAALMKPYINQELKVISVAFDKHAPTDITLSEQIDLNDKNVLLIDDVSNSGKTLLYALKPLLNFYPKRIQTVVLVERMHKQYPIKSDYVGLSVATTKEDFINVEVKDDEITALLVS
jgi:pyrimidine operon attenuation protein/uracil phosphoribosyltransferase